MPQAELTLTVSKAEKLTWKRASKWRVDKLNKYI